MSFRPVRKIVGIGNVFRGTELLDIAKRSNGERVGNIEFRYRLSADERHLEPDPARNYVPSPKVRARRSFPMPATKLPPRNTIRAVIDMAAG
jgi:hypothetical protein